MKSWKKDFAAILVAETLAMVGFGTSMPILPLYLQDLGMTDPASLKFWSGLIQSSASVSLAVFAPIWGSMADSLGRRVMLLRAMFGGAFFVGLMAFATGPWQLLVLRVLQGCVTGTVAAATVMVAGISPVARVGFALGLLQTVISIGNSVGPLVGGVVADLFGRRAAFFATAILLAAAGLIIAFRVEDDTVKDRPSVRLKDIRLLPDFTPVRSSPVLLAMMLVVFALQASTSLAAPILTLFIQELTGNALMVGSVTGMVLGAGAAAAAVAAVVMGRYSARIGYDRTLLLCLAGGALLSFPQAFISTPLQLTILRVGAMFFLGGAIPVVNAIIAERADRNKQGGIYGLCSSVSATGAALGPLIGSAVAGLFDYRAVFTATGLMLAATSAAAMAASPRAVKAAGKGDGA